MSDNASHIFNSVPVTAKGHFVLYYYAAIFRLTNFIQELGHTDAVGSDIEEVFERYPFLAEYFSEMREYMPDEINWYDAVSWWKQVLEEFENNVNEYFPLKSLTQDIGLSVDSCLAFIVIGLIEEDSRFGTLFAEMQQPLNERRTTLQFVGQIILAGKNHSETDDPWVICRPLIEAGLVEVLNNHDPRSEWVLRIPHLLWDAARGEADIHSSDRFNYYRAYSFPDISQLIYPEEIINQLQHIPGLVDQSKIAGLVIRSDPGCDSVEVIGAIAKTMNLNLIVSNQNGEIYQHLGPICSMTQSVPVIRYNSKPGETIVTKTLQGYSGVICYLLGFEGGFDNANKLLTLELPPPDRNLREKYWRKVTKDSSIEELESITNRYRLSGGYIREVAAIASANANLHGRDSLGLVDVQQAGHALNHQHLDTLADRMEARGSWDKLIVNNSTFDKLLELEQRCCNRENLAVNLGPAFEHEQNHGVRALMTGASGTGKTLAAKVLAAELGMDLYRVDLASIINKYIGETEKNLHHVLEYAEALDVILLLDEGDALLGSRTDVKSAQDRYANLETNYLLQRLEHYQGIILITSNMVENIDRAFKRRMDVLVPFYPPQAEERFHIMELHLPSDHLIQISYLQQVASRCELSGGQIRNAAMHATLLAVEEGKSVGQYHLDKALRSEYQKSGATYPLAFCDTEPDHCNTQIEAFISSFGNH